MKPELLSIRDKQMRLMFMAAAFMITNGCTTTGAEPPRADIIALTEAKPVPPPEILTDPAASDRHNNAIESYADRLHSAGMRLCRYFERTGMDINCD